MRRMIRIMVTYDMYLTTGLGLLKNEMEPFQYSCFNSAVRRIKMPTKEKNRDGVLLLNIGPLNVNIFLTIKKESCKLFALKKIHEKQISIKVVDKLITFPRNGGRDILPHPIFFQNL